MDDLYRWAIPIGDFDRDEVSAVKLRRLFHLVFSSHRHVLRSSPESDVQTSVFLFYWSCLLYLLVHETRPSPEQLRSIKEYCLLYVMVDHQLDAGDSIRRDAILLFKQLLTRHPSMGDSARRLLESELRSVDIQTKSDLSEMEYLAIASEKGGLTVQCLSFLLFDFEQDQAMLLGSLMQLIDDMIDCLDDKQKKIHTIATAVLLKDGCLDRLWCLALDSIFNLGPVYNLFKMIYSTALCYIVSSMPELYGPDIVKRCGIIVTPEQAKRLARWIDPGKDPVNGSIPSAH